MTDDLAGRLDADAARSPLVAAARNLEQNPALDHPAGLYRRLAEALTAHPDLAGLLRARVAGHAAHPVLTDVPIGTWLSAAILDLTGDEGSRAASRTLVGAGILAAVPTALTGLAEYATLGPETRRVGAAHANANSVALLLNTASWLSRRSGRHRAGQVLSLAALAAGGAGAFLGGHLALARNVASRAPEFDDSRPEESRPDVVAVAAT